ncbi:GNAT family N-acetyltransferase [Paenibacillus sp. sgz500958]|uniref:GNAT family N-acetyltransferase n=1 Tax=Paenibacillus sp. sgz500958 TaxID=3242475 RepID=UPI0036D2D0ED
MRVTLRKLIPEDACELLKLQHKLDQESSFMLLEPDERHTGQQMIREMIVNFEDSESSIFIGAEVEGSLVGYLSLRGGTVRRNRHCGYIVMGIIQEYQGLGIGKELFREMNEWARAHHITRVELTVMTHNTRALALYTKNGFTIEGTKVKSLKVDGQYVDEYYMSKIIEESE